MRRTTKLSIGISVAGAFVFAGGAGTSAAIALDAKQSVEFQFAKAKRHAEALYGDDAKNQKKLAQIQGKVTSARGALVSMRSLLGEAPWLSAETRTDLDAAITGLETYGEDSAPGDPLPKPRVAGQAASLFVLRGEIDRLREYTLDHEEDHDATHRALRHATASLDSATSVLSDIVLQSVIAGQPVPQA